MASPIGLPPDALGRGMAVPDPSRRGHFPGGYGVLAAITVAAVAIVAILALTGRLPAANEGRDARENAVLLMGAAQELDPDICEEPALPAGPACAAAWSVAGDLLRAEVDVVIEGGTVGCLTVQTRNEVAHFTTDADAASFTVDDVRDGPCPTS